LNNAARLLLLAAILWLHPSTGYAQSKEFKADTVTVIDAWAPPTLGSQRTGVVYFTLVNSGGAEDRLVAVSAKGAGWAALHTNIKDGDVMRMRPLDGLSIPPGATIKLKPRGNHLMLFDLQSPLIAGQKLSLQMQFARAGKMTVEAEISDQAPDRDRDHMEH